MRKPKPKVRKVVKRQQPQPEEYTNQNPNQMQEQPEYDFGGQFKAALPGSLEFLGGAASEFLVPGNPAGIGMMATGAAGAVSGVSNYNDKQTQLKQQQVAQYNQSVQQ